MGAVTGIDFGREHFGRAELGDERRTERLVKAAGQITCHPGGTLPQKVPGPADLKALYRLVGRPEVTHEAVLATHRGRTLALMGRHPGVVLTIHDTTQLDYTTRRSLAGLGQIAKGDHRGYLCHNTLAVDAATGDVIGLANQILHRRAAVPERETLKARRARADRETRLWTAGSGAVGRPAGRPAGRRPSSTPTPGPCRTWGRRRWRSGPARPSRPPPPARRGRRWSGWRPGR